MVSLPSRVSWVALPSARSITHRLRSRTKLTKPPLGDSFGSVAKPSPWVSLRTAALPAFARSYRYRSPPSGNSRRLPSGDHWYSTMPDSAAMRWRSRRAFSASLSTSTPGSTSSESTSSEVLPLAMS